MLQDLYNRKQRFKDFFSDTRKGFLLIWSITPGITLINLALFILQSVFPVLSLVVLKQFIDIVMQVGALQWQGSGIYLLAFGLLQLGNAVATQFSQYYQLLQQEVITDRISERVLERSIAIDLEYYENPAHYDELHMVQRQSLYKPILVVNACLGLIQGVITIALLAGYLVMVHWSIIVLVVILGIPMAISKLLNGYQQYLLDRDCTAQQRKSNDLYKYLTTDDYAKEVRIYNFGLNFIERYSSIRKSIFNKKKHLQQKFLRQSLFIQTIEIIVIIAIYAIIVGSAVEGIITVGGLVIYLQVFQRLQAAITSFFQSGISLFQNQLYLKQILDYLATPSLPPPSVEAVPALVKGISIKGLDFVYPQTERYVLKDVSMELKAGQITAIVGENGSGKSTLIKLLCKLYNVPPDTIHFDGNDMADIDAAKLRENIAVVFQDFGKYYLNVEDNIVINTNEKEEERLIHASRKAGIHSKIQSFPNGYKTVLGRTFKNGEQLSGGQWQKIALARGFYKNSNVLILDEPTSSIDPLAEHEIFENLKKDIGNKIIILVTHRLYNLKLADNIYMFENGAIVENGTFDELVAAKGAFYNIYEKQAV